MANRSNQTNPPNKPRGCSVLLFLKKTEFKNIVAARAVLWCVVPEVGTMARTWTLNAAELLRVVWEGELDGVLKEVTQESVGRVGICRQDRHRNVHPLNISTIGRIDFVAAEGTFVTLKGPKGQEHVDGNQGEVFVLEYHKSRRVPMNNMSGSFILFLINGCTYTAHLHFNHAKTLKHKRKYMY